MDQSRHPAVPFGRASGGATIVATRSNAVQQGPASFWHYMITSVTSNYANFRGRASRMEFWAFHAMALPIGIVGAIGEIQQADELVAVSMLVMLAVMVPAVAVVVRRLHDLGASGWFYLLSLVPVVGLLLYLACGFAPSAQAANRWGVSPSSSRT